MTSASSARVAGSFRDPSGFAFRRNGLVHRQVNAAYRATYDALVEARFYDEAIEAGLLVSHRELAADEIEPDGAAYKVLLPEQLPFVSYPYEWCFGQLKEAALLTLQLQRFALERGFWLKDASAYNVQFHRGRAVLIDSLSFEAYPEGRPWVAYQQFCKHFLAPLALMSHRHVELGKLHRVYVDGVPLDVASALLPRRTRYLSSLALHVHAHARALRAHAVALASRGKATGRLGRTGLLGLIESLEGSVRALDWQPQGTPWGDYYDATSYSEEAHADKKAVVDRVTTSGEFRSAWDLGANTGVFSRICASNALHTVAFDADPAAVEKNHRQCRSDGVSDVLPLVLDLSNPSTDQGWDNQEQMSLRARGPADLVLALALVHHLAIGNNVPFARIAQFLRRLCRTLLIEFVPKDDSQVQRLLAAREDIFGWYAEAVFLRDMESSFVLRETFALRGSEQRLHLFTAREA